MPNKWTQSELNFLRENCSTMTHKQIAAILKRTTGSVKAKATVLKCGYKFHWTSEQIEILKREYATTKAQDLAERFGCYQNTIYKKAGELGLKKDLEWVRENARENMLNPNHPGRKTQFQKGFTPFNKGMKGFYADGSEIGWFKKGHLPHTTLEVGATVVDEDGYTKIKIAMPNKWQFFQRYLWEKHFGAIPAGFTVVFKDGNRKNFALDNLEAISRNELVRRNRAKFLAYPNELKQLIYTLALLNRRINNAAKNKIADLRNLMFETIERLLDDEDNLDVAKAKAIAQVGQVIVQSAKAEIEFLREVGGTGSGFIPDGSEEPKMISGREN